MVDCVDILRSITKSCGDNVGGVNKRVWITQLQQIERYTFDSLGYVNSITTKEIGATNYGYELKKVISKKGSHSGNVEAIENVNVDVFKHTAILKAYATTPEQRDSLVSLYGASKVVVFFETDNGEIEIYGLENGLYATALTGNTGEQMQDDTAFTFTLSGLQTSLPKYFLYGGSLATSIAYLDEIGLNPIYVIQEYSAGTSTINFTNNGGDDWDIDFKIATDAPPQLPSGCTIESYDIDIRLFKNGNNTTIDSSTGITTDITKNTSGNGAGVYSVNQTYNVFLGSTNVGFFRIQSLYKVDGSGNLLAYIKCKGITINSVNGLNISVTAIVEQSESYPIQWYSYNSSFNQTLIGSGLAASLTLPIDCAYLVAIPTLDSVFTNDFPAQMNAISMVTIN